MATDSTTTMESIIEKLGAGIDSVRVADRMENLKLVNEDIVDGLEGLSTDLGGTLKSQINDLLKQQAESSVRGVAQTQEQINKLNKFIDDNANVLGRDAILLRQAIQKSNEASEFSRSKIKQLSSTVAEMAKNTAVDALAVTAGLFGDSPIMMFATKWIGDKTQTFFEERKKKREEQEAKEREQSKQVEKEAQKVAALRELGYSEEEIARSLLIKQQKDAQDAQEEWLESVRKEYGLDSESEPSGSPMTEEANEETEEIIDELQRISQNTSELSDSVDNNDREDTKNALREGFAGMISSSILIVDELKEIRSFLTNNPNVSEELARDMGVSLESLLNVLNGSFEQDRTLAEESEISRELEAVRNRESQAESNRELQRFRDELIDELEQINEELDDLNKEKEEGGGFGIFGTLLGILGLGIIAATSFAEGVIEGFKDAGKLFSNMWRGIKNFFSSIGNALNRGIRFILGDFMKPIDNFMDGIRNTLTTLKTSVSNFFKPIANFFRNGFNLVDDLFPEGGVLKKLGDMFSKGWNGLKNIGSTLSKFLVLDWIPDFTFIPEGIMRPIMNIIDNIGGFIGNTAKFFGRFFAPIMAAFDGIMGFIDGYAKEGLWGGVKGAIEGIVEGFIGGFKFLISDVGGWILEAVGLDALAGFIRGLGDTVMETLDGLFGGLWDVIEGIFTLDWGKITDGAGKIFGAVWDLLVDFKNLLMDLVRDAFDFIPGVSSSDQKALNESASDAIDAEAQKIAEAEGISIDDARERVTENLETAKDSSDGVDWGNWGGNHEVDDWEDFEESAKNMSAEQLADLIRYGDSEGAGWEPSDREKLLEMLSAKGGDTGDLELSRARASANKNESDSSEPSRVPSGGAPVVPEESAGSESERAEYAMEYLQEQGWTPEQAAGIVGNLQAESGSNMDTKAVGDGGQAKGIAQWHPPRQKEFERLFGKPVEEGTFEEQLAFVNWELNNTESKAGNAISKTTTAEEAAYVTDKMYERSAGLHTDRRMSNANRLLAMDEMNKERRELEKLEEPTTTVELANVSNNDFLSSESSPLVEESLMFVPNPKSESTTIETTNITPATLDKAFVSTTVEPTTVDEIPFESYEEPIKVNSEDDKSLWDNITGFFSDENEGTDMSVPKLQPVESTAFDDSLMNPNEFSNQGQFIDVVSRDNADMATSGTNIVSSNPTVVNAPTSNNTTAVIQKKPIRNEKGTFNNLNERNSFW